jgi:hypothetical protein
MEEEFRSSAADLKLANKRLEILQAAFNADCHQGVNASSIGGENI